MHTVVPGKHCGVNNVHCSGLASSRKCVILFCMFCSRETDTMGVLLHPNAACFSCLGRVLMWSVLISQSGRNGVCPPSSCPKQPHPVSRRMWADWPQTDLLRSRALITMIKHPRVCQTPSFPPGGAEPPSGSP